MSKRFTKPSIVWAEVEKRVPLNQKANYFAFKAKSDSYLRRVQSYPEEPPKIDWVSYQKSVPVSGLVDKFKSAYESLKVPYPEDNVTKEIDAQWTSLQAEIKDFCVKSKQRIDECDTSINPSSATTGLPPVLFKMDIGQLLKSGYSGVSGHTARANKELSRIKALPKFEDMTLEMYYELEPKEAVDFSKSFWPHNPEEQVDYEPPKVAIKEEKK